jgi:hypothetical protein
MLHNKYIVAFILLALEKDLEYSSEGYMIYGA